MKKILFVPVLLAGAVLIPAFAPHAQACSPAPGWPPTLAENATNHDAVFIGTVTNVTREAGEIGDYVITFDVEEKYKGELGDTIKVSTNSSSAACGYDDEDTFTKGSVWSVFAQDEDGSYTTTSLSLNTKHVSVEAAASALAKGGVVPEPDNSIMCTEEYAPVCGRMPNGTIRTFGNACNLRAARATQLYVGECSAVSVVPKDDQSIGSRGDGVTWLQSYLIGKALGPAAEALKAVGPTGYFGRLTSAALAEFQVQEGITPARGYFGAKTRALIEAKFSGQ